MLRWRTDRVWFNRLVQHIRPGNRSSLFFQPGSHMGPRLRRLYRAIARGGSPSISNISGTPTYALTVSLRKTKFGTVTRGGGRV